MNLPVRILSSLFIFIFSLFIIATPIFAQSTQPQAPKQDLHNYTQQVMIEVASSMTCMLAGVNAIDPNQKCLGIANGKIGPVDTTGGAIGAMGNLIALTFTPPAHTGDYVKYLASNFGFAKPAYAQQNGIGFQGLSPILPAWTAFRNIVYLLFVLVFIAIGFAIMLRVKIDPRTVMTVENQIPKIIIALILVTFSFAIAGFLIDLMWVAIYLVYNVFAGIPGVTLTSLNPNAFQGQTPLEAANGLSEKLGVIGLTGPLAGSIVEFFKKLFGLGVLDPSIMNILIHAISPIIAVFAANAGADAATKATGSIPLISGVFGAVGWAGTFAATLVTAEAFFREILPRLIIFLVISMSVLYALLRLWFQLIMAYIFILIDIVFAPFWIIMGLVPGSGLTLGAWLRHITAYLVSFPATIVIFLLGKTFIDLFGKNPQAFVPPLIGNPGDTNLIGSLIGFGIILTAPNIVNMMVNALKAPKFDIAPIFQAIGVGTGTITGIPAGAAGYGSMLFGLSHVRGVSRLTRALGYDPSGGPQPRGH